MRYVKFVFLSFIHKDYFLTLNYNRVVSDIAIFVLKRDVKLQLTNYNREWN